MCDTQITPNVATIDKLPVGARVFIDGKNRPLHVTETPDQIHTRRVEALAVGSPDVRVTNLNGEDTRITASRIVSVVEPTGSQRRPVEVANNVFVGRSFRLLSLADYNMQANIEGWEVFHTTDDYQFVILGVGAIDPMEPDVPVVVLTVEGVVFWTNPATPERAIKRYVKVARLLAEAETLTDVANDPGTLPAA